MIHVVMSSDNSAGVPALDMSIFLAALLMTIFTVSLNLLQVINFLSLSFFFPCRTKSELNITITSFKVIATRVQTLLNSSLNFKALFYPVFRKSPINKAEGSNAFLAHQCRGWCRRLRFLWGLGFISCLFCWRLRGLGRGGKEMAGGGAVRGERPLMEEPEGPGGQHGAGREQ